LCAFYPAKVETPHGVRGFKSLRLRKESPWSAAYSTAGIRFVRVFGARLVRSSADRGTSLLCALTTVESRHPRPESARTEVSSSSGIFLQRTSSPLVATRVGAVCRRCRDLRGRLSVAPQRVPSLRGGFPSCRRSCRQHSSGCKAWRDRSNSGSTTWGR